MGPEAAVNAVYANKIEAIEDEDERAAYVAARREEYEADIDLERLASELVLDGIVQPAELRREVATRLRYAAGTDRSLQRPPARGPAGLTASFSRLRSPSLGSRASLTVRTPR